MAESSAKRLLAHYILKLKTFFFSKDVLSFLMFLALSAAFWFVNAIDKEREAELTIPVTYTGVPQNILITSDLPSHITVQVKDKGLNLFSLYGKNSMPMTVDLGRVYYEKGEFMISSDQIRGRLLRYLEPTTSILSIKPDSILIQYEKLSTRELPVVFQPKIELAQQYVLSDKISLTPASVTVFGPKHTLDKLKYVQTVDTELVNLSDTTHLVAKLKPIKGVRFSTSAIKVSIYVEMFTEKKMTLPVTVINTPEHMTVRTFPAMVNVTFNVGMSHFNTIRQDDVLLLFDYNQLKNSDDPKQKLIIQNNTTYISNIRLEPDEVEYVVESN